MFVPRVYRRDSVNRADTGARDSGVLLQTVASIEDLGKARSESTGKMLSLRGDTWREATTQLLTTLLPNSGRA
jgi:hypothetical protein